MSVKTIESASFTRILGMANMRKQRQTDRHIIETKRTCGQSIGNTGEVETKTPTKLPAEIIEKILDYSSERK